MKTLHDARTITRQEGRGSLALWFAVLGSPMAWAGHLALNYSLEEWFACSPSARRPGHVLGLGVETVSLTVNSAMALIAVIAGLVAFACWRKLKAAPLDERTERARWMAFAGIVEAVLFLGIILLGYVPPLLLGVCETAP